MSEEYRIQRFRGGFALVWHEGGIRRRRQLYAENRPGAEAEARDLWQRSNDAPWTVGRIVEGYIEMLEGEEKPSTQRRKDAWKAMRLFWADTDPVLIDAEMCKDYAAQREASPATIRYELLVISSALKWASDRVPSKPELWLPKPPERKIRHLDHDQFETFFAGVRAPHAQLYVLLGLYTMARPSAILELTWDQVDFDRDLIDLNPPGRRQTAKRRPVVKMNEALRDALVKAYAARQSRFIIERAAQQVRCIKKAFLAASERSGISATAYTLRHTGAVWAAEAGISMTELAQYMGHDDDRTTQKHYARYSPDYLVGVANAVQRRPKTPPEGA